MAITDTTGAGFRELAHRRHDGVDVALFWHEPTGELTVSVSDERTGVNFELVAEPERALDVFDHPYAYAAFQDLLYEEALLAAWEQGERGAAFDVAHLSEEPTR